MYEIWLGLNIMVEIALTIWPQLLGIALVWLALMLAARRRLAGKSLRGALLLGVLVAVAMFFALPTLTQSSLTNMDYWVDWASLIGMALGFGAAAAIFLWPVLSLACPHCRAHGA